MEDINADTQLHFKSKSRVLDTSSSECDIAKPKRSMATMSVHEIITFFLHIYHNLAFIEFSRRPQTLTV